MARRIGLDAKLYRGTAGSSAATLMTNIQDVTTNDSRGEADISTRGSEFVLTKSTMRTLDIGFKMLVDETDVDYLAIRAAYNARTPLAFMVLSSATGEGPDADWEITQFNRNEPLKEGQTIDVTIKPTYVTRYPAWHS